MSATDAIGYSIAILTACLGLSALGFTGLLIVMFWKGNP